MTKDEAELYIELLNIAKSEGIGSEAAYELGKRVMAEHFPAIAARKRADELRWAEESVANWRKKAADEGEWERRTGRKLPQMPRILGQLRLAEDALAKLKA